MNQFTILITIINGAAIVGAFIYFSRSGANGASREVIDIFKTRDVEQKKQIAGMQESIKEMDKRISYMSGQMVEKDKKIADLIQIFQGRDPKQTEYMNEMTKLAVRVDAYMVNTPKVFNEILQFMKHINSEFARRDQKDTDIANVLVGKAGEK